MCKKANRYYLAMLLFVLAASFATAIMQSSGVELPYWFAMNETYIVMLIPTVIFMCIAGINPKKKLPFKALKPLDILLSILYGYMLVPMMVFLNFVSMFFVENHLQEPTVDLIYQYPFVVQLIIMALIPGIVEEFIFRGLIYHSHRKNGILGAALLSALCFAMLHLNFNQFNYALILGVALALIVESTSSLYSSMLAHTALNSFSIIMINFTPEDMMAGSNEVMQNLSSAQMMASNIMTAVVWGMLAFGFGAIAVVICKKLAKRNNRYEYMKLKISQGVHAVNGEKFVTAPLIIAMVICFGFMMLLQ
ncbi:MAG: type II CAAX endopeptidase family protein [Clostridia bacterium]|nr:type II CAAX endopeptidase family protein [Clostridia bacterium]